MIKSQLQTLFQAKELTYHFRFAKMDFWVVSCADYFLHIFASPFGLIRSISAVRRAALLRNVHALPPPASWLRKDGLM